MYIVAYVCAGWLLKHMTLVNIMKLFLLVFSLPRMQ